MLYILVFPGIHGVQKSDRDGIDNRGRFNSCVVIRFFTRNFDQNVSKLVHHLTELTCSNKESPNKRWGK